MRVTAGLNDQITMYFERNQSSELPPMNPAPRVMTAPTDRSPVWAVGSVIGTPICRKKRSVLASVVPKSKLPPSSQTAPLPPRRARVSTRAPAISLSASSQPIRFHWPAPRAPTRLSGYRSRVGPSIRSLQLAPFWQPRGFQSGTVELDAVYGDDCSSRQTIPSRTYRFHAHAEMQLAVVWVPRTTRSQRQRWR